uniref:Uncharacterized protein n=1 Tax=Oryza sativa subsp. japonica TaxID=39947 RepID=Q53JB9_ORYSJ|nr:hypothetical protein [Oryza sativa Japonica Group]
MPPSQSRSRPSPVVVRGRAALGLRSGEKSVGVAGELMPLVFEGLIMIQEWCTVWYISGQSKTIRIAEPAVMGGSNNVFRD